MTSTAPRHAPNRIKELRKARGLTLAELARRAGTTNQQVSKLELGQIRLSVDWIDRLAAALGVAPAALLPAAGPDLHYPAPAQRGGVLAEPAATFPAGPEIAELDGHQAAALAGLAPPSAAGGAPRDRWRLPPDYLRLVLGAAPEDAAILRVEGDAMAPTLLAGDRVMVNLADRRPSPPGLFALWDGDGVIVRRLERLLDSAPPRVAVTADNTQHRSYEVAAAEIRILGRVVWLARAL